MTNIQTYPVYVVAGTCGDETQYWAAAVARRKAAQEVRNVLGPEWKTTVLDWRLPPERIREAKFDAQQCPYDRACRSHALSAQSGDKVGTRRFRGAARGRSIFSTIYGWRDDRQSFSRRMRD